MKLSAFITNHSEITIEKSENGQSNIHCEGSYDLVKKINSYRKQYGDNPIAWPETAQVKDSSDILINEIIQKLKDSYKLTYQHEELCHCRLVPTEVVVQSIKQGCRSVKEVSRVCKAGTGCGSCIPNIEETLMDILKTIK